MRRKYFRLLSLAFFIVGVFLLLNTKIGITGAVIGFSDIFSRISFLLGTIFIVIGIFLLMLQESESIEDIVRDIHEIIDEQKAKNKTKPGFVRGLKEIERSVEDDKDRYYRISGSGKGESHLRKAILKRLKRWKGSLKRRAEYFFQIPHHVKHDQETRETKIIDLPDKGLYEYEPLVYAREHTTRDGKKRLIIDNRMRQKGSRYVELEVTHYTPGDRYKKIKRNFEHGKDEVMFEDANGWTYFVSEPLPERLPLKTVRRILGTGNQIYTGKTAARNPEYEVKFKVRVPKERVLVKEETYHLPGGEDLDVRKYAIAGGISREDIVNTPEGKRYVDKNLPEYHANKRKERWKKPA